MIPVDAAKASGPIVSAEATLHGVPQRSEPVTPSADAKPIDTTPLCDGRFVPFARLGSGSQAETLEGVDRLSGQLVAIKRFDVHGAASWKDVDLAEREARVLSSLRHPGLAKYIHHFEQSGSLYLVMERLEGEDLARCLTRGKRFTQEELLELLEALADVLTYLHGQTPPIVHRDIKPSNLIKRADGRYALIDFGSVRDGLCQGGSTVVGTFGYMAPEQFQGRALPASDLFGVGATLLTLMTGATPDKLPHRGLEINVRASLPRTTPEPWLQLLEHLLIADPDHRATALEPLLVPLRMASSTRAASQHPSDPHGASSSRSWDTCQSGPMPETLSQPMRAERVFATGTGVPFILIVILHIVRIAVFLTMQVALPILLGVLSMFFGRALRQAAAEVSSAGRSTDQQLSQLLAQLSHRPFVMSHRRGAEPSQRWDVPNETARPAGQATRPGRKRRTRVGSFEVDLPDEANEHDAAADAEKARRDQHRSR